MRLRPFLLLRSVEVPAGDKPCPECLVGLDLRDEESFEVEVEDRLPGVGNLYRVLAMASWERVRYCGQGPAPTPTIRQIPYTQ